MREIKHLSVHQWLRSAIPDSQQPSSPINFLFLKLPRPPCAVLLVELIYPQDGDSLRLGRQTFTGPNVRNKCREGAMFGGTKHGFLSVYIYICVCVNLCLPIPRMQIYGYIFLDCCSWHQSSFVWGANIHCLIPCLSGCNSSLWWLHRAHHAVATRARGTLWVWQIETGGHKLKDMCHFGEFMVFLAVFVVSGVKLPWMVCSHFYELQSASRVRCLALWHYGKMALHLLRYPFIYL